MRHIPDETETLVHMDIESKCSVWITVDGVPADWDFSSNAQ